MGSGMIPLKVIMAKGVEANGNFSIRGNSLRIIV
jgi:hypothetical protein